MKKYVTLFYRDTMDIANEFVCDSCSEKYDWYEFINCNCVNGYTFFEGRKTSAKMLCSHDDYDFVILDVTDKVEAWLQLA